MTPQEALWLILETDHATSMAQLSVSTSILAGVGGHLENNHSGDLKKRLTTEEERGQQEHSQILTAKQIAFMIYSFKTSSVQGAVLDLADPLKVELRGDNPRAFDSCWEETSFSLAKDPDTTVGGSLYYQQFEKSPQVKGFSPLDKQNHERKR